MSHLSEDRDLEGHPSAIAIEQFAFDDEGQLDAATIEHIKTCDRCGALVLTLREERTAFRVTHPSTAFMARLEERIVRPRHRFDRFRMFFPAVAFAAAVGAVALVVTNPSDVPSSPNGVKMKGETKLALHVHVSRAGEPATPFDLRDPLHEGDIVRFVADLPEGGYAALLSVDERQKLSWYHPTSASPARRLAAGRSKVLPGAIQFDDYVGRELLVLTLSDVPVDKSAIEARVRQALDKTKGDLTELHRRGLGTRSVSRLVVKETTL